MTTIADLSPESRAILRVTLAAQRAIAERPEPPAWRSADLEHWRFERDRGPWFSAAGWFGVADDIGRRRYVQAIIALVAAGLLTTFKRRGQGGRITNIKLTAEGERVARELRAAIAHQCDRGSTNRGGCHSMTELPPSQYLDAQPFLDAAGRFDRLLVSEVYPDDALLFVAQLPADAEWLHVRLSEARGRENMARVFATRRPIGWPISWPGEWLDHDAALGQLALWLRLRLHGDVRTSRGWLPTEAPTL